MILVRNMKEGLLGGLCLQAVIVGLMALLGWWTISSRLVLLDGATSTIHAAPLLDREVATLEQAWSPERAATVAALVDSAEKQLLEDFDHLAVWLKHIKHHASSLGLRISHTVEETESTPLDGIAVVPIQFVVHADRPDHSYPALLKFMRLLAEETVRVDVQRTEMSGKGEGLERMDVLLHLMMRNET